MKRLTDKQLNMIDVFEAFVTQRKWTIWEDADGITVTRVGKRLIFAPIKFHTPTPVRVMVKLLRKKGESK